MYPIEKRLIPIQQKSLLSTNLIIAHESGNPSNTGPQALENEVQYMSRKALEGGPFVSHWVGAGGRIIQIAATGRMQQGAGRKANPHAFAQVELVRTQDFNQFQKDYRAYTWLLCTLAREAGIPISLNHGTHAGNPGIKTHRWVTQNLGGTTHVDPDAYLAGFGVSMQQFKQDIERTTSSLSAPQNDRLDAPYVYIIKKGDTLWQLALAHGMTVNQLKKENGLTSSTLHIGQSLRIPFLGMQTEPYLHLVRTIQKQISCTPDGLFGPLTVKSVFLYIQKLLSLSQSGHWDIPTQNKLVFVRRGVSHPTAFLVQCFLIKHGFLVTGTPDGICGPRTEKGISTFQHYMGLEVDGIAGPATWNALFS